MLVITKTTAYGVTAEDPTTEVRVADDKKAANEILAEYVAEAEERGFDVESTKKTARWVDPDEDSVTVVEIHNV